MKKKLLKFAIAALCVAAFILVPKLFWAEEAFLDEAPRLSMPLSDLAPALEYFAPAEELVSGPIRDVEEAKGRGVSLRCELLGTEFDVAWELMNAASIAFDDEEADAFLVYTRRLNAPDDPDSDICLTELGFSMVSVWSRADGRLLAAWGGYLSVDDAGQHRFAGCRAIPDISGEKPPIPDLNVFCDIH